MAKPKGSPKTGGRAKGTLNKVTLDKNELRQLYRDLATPHMKDVLEAQLDTAKGVQHMMAKDSKTGQWIQVTDPAVMLACLNSGESFYKIVAQNPNVQAQKDIFDRLMDQPARQIDIAGPDGAPLEIVVKKAVVVELAYQPRTELHTAIHREMDRHRFGTIVTHRRFGKTVPIADATGLVRARK